MQRSEDTAGPLLTSDELLTYVLGFLVSLTGSLAALLTIKSEVLWQLVPVGLGVGVVVSWALRKVGTGAYGWVVVAGCATVGLLGVGRSGAEFWESVDPSVGMMAPEDGLALVLLAIMVLRSFAILSARDALFLIVPGFALFGLLAGENRSTAFLMAFMVFVLSALALATHEHWLSERQGAQKGWAERASGQHLSAAGGLFVVVALVGTVLVPPLRSVAGVVGVMRMTGPSRFSDDALRRFRPALRLPARTPENYAVGSGPTRFRGVELFRVSSSEPAYWRTCTYEIYTGRRWRSEQGSRLLINTSGVFELADTLGASSRAFVSQTYTFTVPMNELPAAGEPKSFSFITRADLAVEGLVVDDSGRAFPKRGGSIPAGTQYRVVSLVAPAAPPRIRQYTLPPVARSYLRIPFAAQEVANPVAHQVTRGQPTPLDKALALQRWVQSHGRYSIDAPAVPEDEDVVAYFIASPNPRAYCDVYASTLAILCRVVGVPSRLAVGYFHGVVDPEGRVYVVKDSDAHAWAEVYISPVGWVPLEATPPGATQTSAASSETGATLLQRIARYASRAGLAGLAALLLFVSLSRVFVAARQRLARGRPAREASNVLISIYGRVLGMLARSGLGRKGWQTPLEHLEHLRAIAAGPLGPWLGALGELTHDFMQARYSTRLVTPGQIERAQATMERGRRELRRARSALKQTLRAQGQRA
jgi:transglutaminase-like putative cysteine protease